MTVSKNAIYDAYSTDLANEVTGTLPVANGGTGSTTADGAKANLGLPPVALGVPAYVSTRTYLAGPLGQGSSDTNTNTLTADTLYGSYVTINQSTTISALRMRTSSSNASVGASILGAIYNVDSAGQPTTLVAQTPALAVGDGATTNNLTLTFASNVVLAARTYIFAVLATAVTTAVRLAVYSSGNVYRTYSGASTAANMWSTNAIVGFTTTGNTFASGAPATYTANSAVTDIVSVSNAPAIGFTVV